MKASIHGLTPDILAAGLVAACRLNDCPPLLVFNRSKKGAGQARVAVAAALVAAHRPTKVRDGATCAYARLLLVSPTALSPNGLAKRRINADALLAVHGAMRTAGLGEIGITGAPKAGRKSKSPPTEPKARLSKPDKPVKAAPSERAVARLRSAQRALDAPAFDPAVLGVRRKPVAADPAPVRQDDIRYGGQVAKPLDLGAGDLALVSACNRQGGFPVIFKFEPAQGEPKLFWLNAKGENWKHRA